jgi:hypothetical protein
MVWDRVRYQRCLEGFVSSDSRMAQYCDDILVGKEP